MAEPQTRPARRRRTAPEAQRLILDAAEKRLTEGGPEAVRLQDIARDLGISHPSILHHFGSREALLGALEDRAMDELRRAVLSLPRSTTPVALEQAFATLGDAGHARLLAWQSLTGRRGADGLGGALMHELTESLHGERRARAALEGGKAPSREETSFAIHLAAVAMFGDALIGDLLTMGTRVRNPERYRRRFRRWLGDLLDREGVRPVDPS